MNSTNFSKPSGFDVAKRVVSKAALTKARMKLNFEAFVDLNLQMIQYFEKQSAYLVWLSIIGD